MGLCLECEHGYFVTPMNTCAPCPEGCDHCLHEGYCKECREGYFLPDNFLEEGIIDFNNFIGGR